MAEIFYNKKIENYTFEEEISGVKSIKMAPIKFKLNDSTSRFRKDILRTEILNN